MIFPEITTFYYSVYMFILESKVKIIINKGICKKKSMSYPAGQAVELI